jgi:adenylosuccinate synthase
LVTGDEGKGKLSDILCQKARVCARAAGGHNAGHSVVYVAYAGTYRVVRG